MSQLWVIRVAVGERDRAWFDNPFLECLRHADLVNVHPTRTPAGHQVFDIFPPKHYWNDSRCWADINSARMATFGLNAVTAPAGAPVVPILGVVSSETVMLDPVKAAALLARPGEGIEEAMERVEKSAPADPDDDESRRYVEYASDAKNQPMTFYEWRRRLGDWPSDEVKGGEG